MDFKKSRSIAFEFGGIRRCIGLFSCAWLSFDRVYLINLFFAVFLFVELYQKIFLIQ